MGEPTPMYHFVQGPAFQQSWLTHKTIKCLFHIYRNGNRRQRGDKRTIRRQTMIA